MKALTLPGQVCLTLVIFLAFASITHSQQLALSIDADSRDYLSSNPSLGSLTGSEIIERFIEAESRFRATLIQFSFKRNVILQTIGKDGKVTGEYVRESVFVLDDRGQRVEQVLYHPKPTIKALTITKEDIQDLAGSQLFGLELANCDAYRLSYAGQETLGQHTLYVVDVRPKQPPNPEHMRERFFVGRIWIDRHTFQPIYLEGITEPHGKQRFPLFRTERLTEIENQRFPSATYADDVLHFPHQDVRYRIAVSYYDFKRFASRVKIVEIE